MLALEYLMKKEVYMRRKFPKYHLFNEGYDVDVGWESQLDRNDKGAIKATFMNVIHAVRHSPELNGAFSKSALDDKITVIKKLPGETVYHKRLLSDADLYTVMAFLGTRGIQASKDAVFGAITETVKKYTLNPIQSYLDKCRVGYDGEMRLNTLLHDLFGSEDTSYNSAVGRKFMIGAVARALDPGCKMDNMLILEGKGGIGKSTGVAALLPDIGWLVDSLPDVSGTEAAIQIRGKWIVELAELAGNSRKERNDFKRFVTATFDTYRAPYERTTQDIKRMCVIIGTTNESNYLDDPTGNRRFWPVSVTDVDVKRISELRDQLWGEAVHLYLEGEDWSLTKDEAVLAIQEQDARFNYDPWREHVLMLIDGKNEVTTSQLLIGLGIEVKDHDNRRKARLKSILTKEGWIAKKLRSSENRDKYGYIKGD